MFEILAGLPPYGDLPAVIGGGDSPVYREGYVIRFNEATPAWVGNFQRGLTTLDFAVAFDSVRVLIIAGGAPYLVDPHTRSVEKIDGDYDRCYAVPDRAGFLLADFTDIALLTQSGLAWQSRRLAWDGLRIESIGPQYVHGEARHFDDTWHAFQLDLNDGSAQGGAFPDAPS